EVTWLTFGEGLVLRAGEQREVDRLGDAEPGCSPSGYFRCADGAWVAVVDRTSGPGRRPVDRDADDAELAAWTAAHPSADVVATLRARGVAVQPALTYAEARPELEARGILERLTHPVTGDRPYLALPTRIDGRPWRSSRPAACFAQHTDEVLRDWLRLDDARLASLRASSVIGTMPAPR
ncbi:MAG TPA: CoA transferase, partial [Acidimicrobiales bacterium]|nr:CoA transferase [Acidimicrobiales bacterium]